MKKNIFASMIYRTMRPANLLKTGAFAFCIFLSSCNPFALKPLDVQTVTAGAHTARWFYTSDISTVHNHVEIKTKNGWEQVLETNGYGGKLYDVSIDSDTVIIRTPATLVYQLQSYYWGTYVRLDTSISEVEYDRKYYPSRVR